MSQKMDSNAVGGLLDNLHARVKNLQDHVGSPERTPLKGVSPAGTEASTSEPAWRTVEEASQAANEHRLHNVNSLLEYKVEVLEREKAALVRELTNTKAVADLVQQFEAALAKEREDRQVLIDKIDNMEKTTEHWQTQQELREPAASSGLMDRMMLNEIPAICMRLEKRIEDFGENLERSTSSMRVAMEREAHRREAQRRVSQSGTSTLQTKRQTQSSKSDNDVGGMNASAAAKGLDWEELFHAEQLELTITPGIAAPGEQEEQEEEQRVTRCGCMGAQKKEEVKGWFRIQCKHSSSSWVVLRAASEFVFLHLHLKEQAMLRKVNMEAHHFPKMHFIAATTDKQKKVLCSRLESYLKQLARMPGVASHSLFLQFLQISSATLQKGFEPCRFEGGVTRSTGSAVTRGGCCGCTLTWSWCRSNMHQQRWFVLKDSCLFYMHSPLYFQPMGVMLFDRTSKLSPDPAQFQHERLWHKRLHRIVFSNGGRNLTLHFKHSNQARRWLLAIAKAMESSPYCRVDNKYDAFAPPRDKCKMQWYLNGCAYFHAVAEAIDEARRVVYIAGWFLSPHVYLRRPSRDNEHFRLDKLLQRKAAQGVKIYVLLFRELEVCIEANNSHFAKQVLRGLHSNIFVLRSPNDIAITYHSHHEKLVVTDAGAGCAFIGGIDLAFGRWDTSAYPLADAGEVLLWPGKDYCNEGYCVTKGTDLPFLDHMDRSSEPRMPWHDFAVKVCGGAAFDAARHFIARWNKRTHNEKDSQYAQLIPEVPWTAEDLFEATTESKTKGRPSMEGRTGATNSMTSDTASLSRAERMSLRGRGDAGRVSLSERQMRKALALSDSRKNLWMSNSDSRRHLYASKVEGRRHLQVESRQLTAPRSSAGATERGAGGSRPSQSRTSAGQGPVGGRAGVQSEQVTVSGVAMGRDSIEQEQEDKDTVSPLHSVTASPQADDRRGWGVEIQMEEEEHAVRRREPGRRSTSVERDRPLRPFSPQETVAAKERPRSLRGGSPAAKGEYRGWRDDAMTLSPGLVRLPSDKSGPSGPSSGDMLWGNAVRRLMGAQHMGSQRSLVGISRSHSLPGGSFRRRTSASSEHRDLSHFKTTVFTDTGIEEDCVCQVLRSVDKWSGDLVKENSIEEAYVHLIRNAKHYVHIENQFFVSKCEGSDEVENRVSQAIKDRIIQEINTEKRNNVDSKFRVVVLMPLYPGLPGSPQVNASKRMLLHLQYQTICRNQGLSLMEKLREVTDTPEKYIGFYGLRQWGRLPDGIVRQEQIYIHGKLMIVDDRHILCGSANINDRSLLGKNDSEVALLMSESDHRVQSKMFGKSWEAFRAARDMRKRLYQLHLGAHAEKLDLNDPCSPDMLKAWARVAKFNTEKYREVFRCFPDDQVLSWDTFDQWEDEQEKLLDEQAQDHGEEVTKVEAIMQTVSGHLVEFPLRFLEQEDLFPTWTEKEYHVDRRVFT